MKIKNLNFLEKHVEKIAIAIGLIFFALVLWQFVLGQPYTVDVVTRSGTQTVSPDQVEVMIRDRARSLENEIKKTDTPFDKIPLPKWTDDFRERMTGRFLPVDRLTMPFNWAGLDNSLSDDRTPVNNLRVVPMPPAVAEVTPQADYAVLAAPATQETADKLLNLVGNLNEPRDFRYVSVAATFDIEKWRELLKGLNVASDQRIPEDWWRNRLYLTDIVLERQTLDVATGQWGQTQIIPALPSDNRSFRLGESGEIKLTAAEVPALIDAIRESQDRIARPDFVELERGTWTPPGSQQKLSEEQAREFADIQQKLAQLRRRAKALQGGDARGTTPEPATDAVPPTGEWNNTPAPRGGRPGRAAGGNASLQDQIIALETRRDSLLGIARAEPNAQGGMDGQAMPGDRGDGGRNPSQFRDGQQPRPAVRPVAGERPGDRRRWTRDGSAPGADQGNDALVPALPPVKIWAHDLTAKPGQTYRYRISVAVLNPLFHINDVPREQYTKYFNKLSLHSEPSSWTQPVVVDPERYFFITGQDPARRQVTIDVFRIFNGVWMRNSFDVRAGDSVGRVVTINYKDQSEAVDLDTKTMLVDIAFPAAELSVSSNADQTRAILYNLQDNTMESRTIGQDLANTTYQRLLTEMQIRSAMANQ